ncbi:hypothetical protein WAI453_009330 [Rhynchosporium graminicola]
MRKSSGIILAQRSSSASAAALETRGTPTPDVKTASAPNINMGQYQSTTTVSAPISGPRRPPSVSRIIPVPASSSVPGSVNNIPPNQISTTVSTPVSIPARPSKLPPITWRDIERYAPPNGIREVIIDDISYPFNDINVLRPSGIFILLKVLTIHFHLSETFEFLHLKRHEIDDIEKLLWPEFRIKLYDIEKMDVRDAKRILMAHVREGDVLENCLTRLGMFEGRRLSLQDIESVSFVRRAKGA